MKASSRLLTILLITLGLAACQGQGGVSVEDPWARPGSAGSNGTVYFRIENPANQEDTLLGASSPSAENVELHMSVMGEGETMSMHPQENVPIPGRGGVDFEPGGLHVMLIGLQRDLVEGEQIELTLRFQEAGEITLQVPVEQR